MTKTKELKKAIAHVKKYFPNLGYVVFRNEGWCYMDNDLGALNFGKLNIDASILERAFDSIDCPLPAIFEIKH